MTELWAKIVAKLLRARWIVNSGGEMGIRVAGANLFYYKYDTPIIYGATGECSGWRPAYKREPSARERAAAKLCQIYFEIAAEAIGEDAVRAKRDARVGKLGVASCGAGPRGNERTEA